MLVGCETAEKYVLPIWSFKLKSLKTEADFGLVKAPDNHRTIKGKECKMKKLLIVGGMGFIGRPLVEKLIEKEDLQLYVAIHNSSTSLPKWKANNLQLVTLDMLDQDSVSDLLYDQKFDSCIDLAWYTGNHCHGSDKNLDWLIASLNFVKSFVNAGGKHILISGSIAEYDYSFGYLKENTSLECASIYGKCKTALMNAASSYCQIHNVRLCWPRIFNCYGPNEKPKRLMPSVINAALRGEDILVSSCNKYQDYTYIDDVAEALFRLYNSDFSGVVNICSGKPVLLREIVEKILKFTKSNSRVVWGAIPESFPDQVVLGDNRKLKSVLNWEPSTSLDSGLALTIDWWKSQYMES